MIIPVMISLFADIRTTGLLLTKPNVRLLVALFAMKSTKTEENVMPESEQFGMLLVFGMIIVPILVMCFSMYH
jgi:hypothetical protein